MTTFTKLPSGSWGLRSMTPLALNAPAVVQLKSGQTKMVRPAQLVQQVNGAYLYTVVDTAPSRSTGGYRVRKEGGRCRASGCGALATRSGYCAACYFDEYDN